MMAGHGDDLADGGPARHIPVMLAEVLEKLDPQPGMTIIDGTFGAGGYSKALLDKGAHVVALDRDPDAIAAGQALVSKSERRLVLVQDRFSNLDQAVDQLVDGVVLDIGVSSMQLDEAERGFSFRHDGPLDMRMGQHGPSAADIVNRATPQHLARVFAILGEERHSGRIARMIERRRASRPFTRTLELADAIETTIGRKPGERIHPATRTFQALRIHVNDELGELAEALLAAERVLKPGGVLVVVTFHSLEDRIVKRFITDRGSRPAGSRHLPDVPGEAPTFERLGGMVAASEAEAEQNPRARSAKLRAARRTAEPARGGEAARFGIPAIASALEAGR